MVAVLEGNRNIYWRLTPKENLELFASLRGRWPWHIRDEIDYYLDLFDLAEKRNETVRKLSRGMQQKLAVAISMVTGAPILLLDEPTLGLDVESSYELREILTDIVRDQDRTIIISTHDMNLVEQVCHEVVIINEGKIVTQDKTNNLLNLFQARSYEIIVEKLIQFKSAV